MQAPAPACALNDMPMSYSKTLAVIDEARCIGCTLCIKACPFDAIVGAAKQLHSVIKPFCTGCTLCIEPCPVDCISLQANQPLAASAGAKIDFAGHAACINCGDCAPACPSRLNPQKLYTEIGHKNFLTAAALGLQNCAQCAACDKVCPSHIPLADTFAYGQAMIKIKTAKKAFATASKQRLQRRKQRLRHKQAAQAAFLADQKQALAETLETLKKHHL